MAFEPAPWPRRLRSQEWYGGTSRDVIYHRALICAATSQVGFALLVALLAPLCLRLVSRVKVPEGRSGAPSRTRARAGGAAMSQEARSALPAALGSKKR